VRAGAPPLHVHCVPGGPVGRGSVQASAAFAQARPRAPSVWVRPPLSVCCRCHRMARRSAVGKPSQAHPVDDAGGPQLHSTARLYAARRAGGGGPLGRASIRPDGRKTNTS